MAPPIHQFVDRIVCRWRLDRGEVSAVFHSHDAGTPEFRMDTGGKVDVSNRGRSDDYLNRLPGSVLNRAYSQQAHENYIYGEIKAALGI